MTDRPSARGSSVALEATRTRAQYLDAIEDIACAYIATDRRGIVVDANRVASVMLGCPVLEKALIGFVARGDTHVFRVLSP